MYYYQPQQVMAQPPPTQAYVGQKIQQQQPAPLPQVIPVKQEDGQQTQQTQLVAAQLPPVAKQEDNSSTPPV